MAIYNSPDEILPIFNWENYSYDTGLGISQASADLRYLKKAGDTATGIINFSNGILANDGSNSSPPISFISDSNTGIYRIGSDNLGIACGGVKQIDLSTTLTTFTNPLRLSDGGWTFSSSTNTGFTYTGANRILVSSAGTQVFTFSNGGVNQSVITLSVPNGSAASPGLRASSYATTGLFFKNSPSLCVTTNGVERVDFSSTSALFSTNINMNSNNIVSCPKVQNLSGDVTIECNTTGTGGNIVLSGGTGLLSATSGSSSGQHLVITINGTQYKIDLKNP